ncbi:uncharacterized protein Z518_10368 [Rhinocladiella mackenziei CBS 650.93]|uniref:Uncharacterized protein n=1 Tax=Rhinocladiella mackenziei CBS 650.93 TaxID=1442369 RepID=A0A0D2I375_9EURO|nr:uncharacterized protein Z518_10368 [Rhinocladiella mackenziei CBS 650.93]KIX00229.1 hypothetical protein Z518_10368 [Rhinocladiella mackenziei CBS 650.93]
MKTPSPPQNHEGHPRKTMLLSSRSSPPKPLKFGGTDRYLSIKHLLPRTPIPSPSLPSILPRHGKKPPRLNSRRIIRSLIWLSAIISVYYLVLSSNKKTHDLADLTFLSSLGKTYEIVEASGLPEHPTPLAVTDRDDKQYWTISIPPDQEFPLPSTDYADICSEAEQVARHVASRSHDNAQSDYYDDDPNFIDVDEAQSRHFLPKEVDLTDDDDDHLPVCEKSLTYVLDATDAGLGSALLGLWLSYGLARRENRAFFIDDTNFPYGDYRTFFSSIMSQPCRLPPPTQRVPCPHQAKHLVVSAATTGWIFGESFHRHYTPRQIFDMARVGYEALFKLQKEDQDYVQSRAGKLRGRVDGLENGLVGIHIRRGDRHPYEFAYQHGYLPPDRYMSAVRRTVGQSEQWKLLLASDDADMYDHIELPDTIRAQQRISLASKKTLETGLGWEGGFFKDVFWSLGLPPYVQEQKRIGSPAPTKAKSRSQRPDHAAPEEPVRDYRTNPTKEALHLRELLGRAYLLDLAMLAQSDKVVCAVSSKACQILAIMLGWERAFEKNDWTNVDGNYGWRIFDY